MPKINDGNQPRVPEEEAPDTFVSTPEVGEAIPELATVLVGPGEIDAGSFLFSPGVVPGVVAGYALGGEETLESIEEILRTRAAMNDAGKINKYDAFYAPQTPLPFGVWRYACETCRFFQAGKGGRDSAGQCEIVGHEGDWFGGERVHPSGWCALWVPTEGTKPFEYITDRLEGEQSR